MLHLLCRPFRLAVQVVGVEAEVAWDAAGPLEHLHNSHGRNTLERRHPEKDLRHCSGGNSRVVGGNRRNLQDMGRNGTGTSAEEACEGFEMKGRLLVTSRLPCHKIKLGTA